MALYNKEKENVTSEDVLAVHGSHVKGKVVLITGCSPKGYGAYIAQAVAKHHPALLVLAGRSAARIKVTERMIKAQVPSAQTRALLFDLGSLGSVRKAAEEVGGYQEAVDVVITSGGIMMAPYEKTADGFESQFGVNFLGHFLFVNLLLEKMRLRGGRIVLTTSGAYKFAGVRWDDPNFEKDDYDKFAAYGQSKTADILFAAAIARRYGDKGIVALSAEPGGTTWTTDIVRYLTEEDSQFLQFVPIRTLSEGCASQIAAAFDPALSVHNGELIQFCQPCPLEKDYAAGKENEDRLWALSEKMVGGEFA